MALVTTPASHGGSIRGQTPAGQGIAAGRFARMFTDNSLDRPRYDSPAEQDMLWALAQIMTGIAPPNADPDLGKPIRDLPNPGGTEDPIPARDAADENPAIPAGYTYFGQFVDHDISFDPTPLNGRRIDQEAIDDFRSPALDLDSVYGMGPDIQPYLYDNSGPAILLRVGDDLGMGSIGDTRTTRDHLRLAADAQGKRAAVIGDKRNDENKIVAQMHTAFIALHNRLSQDDAVLQRMGLFDLNDKAQRFDAAVKAARWHYQWVVLHDFVNRLCPPGTVADVLNAGGVPRLGHYLAEPRQYAYLPFEFSVAAYRLGHSMVRPSYALNAEIGTQDAFEKLRIPIFKPGTKNDEALNGFGSALPQRWGIDWSFFLDKLTKPADADTAPTMAIPQLSYRLDANLVIPLHDLPEFQGGPVREANLAYRNLLRGGMDALPSGEAVASQLGIVPLDFKSLWWAGSQTPDQVDADIAAVANARRAFGEQYRDKIAGRTPLWYYILREAEVQGTLHVQVPPDPFGGQHLGAVGSRIVAETFIGLLWMDPSSFLHSQTRFTPVIPASGQKFELADLLRYALG